MYSLLHLFLPSTIISRLVSMDTKVLDNIIISILIANARIYNIPSNATNTIKSLLQLYIVYNTIIYVLKVLWCCALVAAAAVASFQVFVIIIYQ